MQDTNKDSSTTPFRELPGLWDCKGESFLLYGRISSNAYPGPMHFSPLERNSDFASPERSGEFRGGLASVMVVRYSESPAGEYNVMSVKIRLSVDSEQVLTMSSYGSLESSRYPLQAVKHDALQGSMSLPRIPSIMVGLRNRDYITCNESEIPAPDRSQIYRRPESVGPFHVHAACTKFDLCSPILADCRSPSEFPRHTILCHGP